jgi:transposase
MDRRRYTREFKVEAVKLVRERGVAVKQAARDLHVHPNVLHRWMKDFAADPQYAFPGKGQMKPEQLELERLRREVQKLKAERDILKKLSRAVAHLRSVETARATLGSEGSGRQLIGGTVPVKKRGPWVHANLRVVTPFWWRSRLGR